jgi:hypothetical protein
MRLNFRFAQCFMPVFALLGTCVFAHATETNGCGTGWNRFLVPDRIKIIGCDFKKACDNHDVCYGQCSKFSAGSSPAQCEYLRCEKDGDLFAKQECDSVAFRNNKTAATNRRAECDGAFMVDITKTNPNNPKCDLFSGLYPFAVRTLGRKNFLGMEDAEQPSMSDADQSRYADAINKLLSTWPTDKQAMLAKQIREGKANVDLTQPIVFDPNIGLRNVKQSPNTSNR